MGPTSGYLSLPVPLYAVKDENLNTLVTRDMQADTFVNDLLSDRQQQGFPSHKGNKRPLSLLGSTLLLEGPRQS